MNWRSLFGAWYAEDVDPADVQNSRCPWAFATNSPPAGMKPMAAPPTTLFPNGVISTQPHIGNSIFTANNAKFLPQPRIGLAWSPFGHKTVVRAGFGMYNDLQDALGYRTDQNAPFNPTYSIASLPVSRLPINPAAAVPASAKLVPGGVQPDMKTPTLISWSLRIEQELTPNTALTVGYVGSHGYHELIGVDANEPTPTICPASPCPAVYPTVDASADSSGHHCHGFPRRLALGGSARARRELLHSRGNAQSQPCAGQHVDVVFARRQFLQRSASGREPPHESWPFDPRRLHLVEVARRWRFLECRRPPGMLRDWSQILSICARIGGRPLMTCATSA